MAKIIDPDQLNQGTEVTFNTTTKRITLNTAGNLSTDGVTLQCLYSFCKEEWNSDVNLIKYPFPIEAITPEQFEFINGWDLVNDASKNLIRDAGWALKDVAGVSQEEYMGFITLGDVGSTDQIYYQQTGSGDPVNVVLTGPANQAIKIYGDSSHGNINSRNYFKCFVRVEGKLYSQAELANIGVTNMTYQVYRFPLANANDLKITHTDAQIVADTATYQNIDITYYAANQNRSIGGTNYPFRIIIDGNGKTAEQIYEKIQYQLRRTTDIDEGATTVRGDTANLLLEFVGDTLKTKQGVYIDNFSPADTNRIEFYDQNNSKRTFPYVAAGSIAFNNNLVDDGAAIYRMYFASGFGTNAALLVNDNAGQPVQGTITSGVLNFSFDYDGNNQGGRTPGTDANVVVVAIGKTKAQYVKADGVITRSTKNSISLVAALERNYANN